jgi:hypothetical protein
MPRVRGKRFSSAIPPAPMRRRTEDDYTGTLPAEGDGKDKPPKATASKTAETGKSSKK